MLYTQKNMEKTFLRRVISQDLLSLLCWIGVGWGAWSEYVLNSRCAKKSIKVQSKLCRVVFPVDKDCSAVAMYLCLKMWAAPPALWPSGCNMFCQPLMTDLIPYFGPSCWFWFSLMATSCYLLMVDICQAPVHIHLRSNGCVLKM